MNDAAHNSDLDSFLVLLPDSTINPEGIRFLSEISGFDDYIIQNKLRIKLPHILCPVNSHAIAGSSGDLLENLCINFIAVKKRFLAQPFKPFPVKFWGFGKKQSRFFNRHLSMVEIYNEEKILLLEGRYRTTDAIEARVPDDDIRALLKPQKEKNVNSTDLRTYRFVMLYQVMDSNPLVFIDQCMDYSFLDSAKKMTVSANFDVVKNHLESIFSSPVNPAMLQHEYVMKQVQDIGEKKAKGFRLKNHRQMITTALSNESAANRMSQLLFFQWCKENGWIKRIMPQAS
jgi:hypothetical protein